MKPLPQGWEARYDQSGRIYFIDHVRRRSTYDDPRLPTPAPPAIARPPSIPTAPQVIAPVPQVIVQKPQQPLPSGWEVQYDQQRRPYYVDHINKKTTYEDPRIPKNPYDNLLQATAAPPAPAAPAPLPTGWERRLDPKGIPYFIDHIRKRSTYDDPRVIAAQPLPQGWEARTDHTGRYLYIYTTPLVALLKTTQTVLCGSQNEANNVWRP